MRLLYSLLCILNCIACSDRSQTHIGNGSAVQSQDFVWSLPVGIPRPQVPAENPMSEAKFQLGRHLFYDTRLSGNGQQSCASCHQQDKSFTDGKAQAIGSTGMVHPRGAMALINSAYVPTLAWANPNLGQLEQQILLPLFGEHPVEQGITDATLPLVWQRLKAETRYAALFTAAFPGDLEPLTLEHLVQAIATFVRGLTSFNSPFDRYQRGDTQALSASAQRGRQLYFSESLECFHCHGGYNLTDSNRDDTTSFIERPFHNTGLFNIGGKGDYPQDNRGVMNVTGAPADMGKFRAVTLRNIELTAPYMHDGSLPTLEAVIDFYAAGGRPIISGVNQGDGRRNPLKDGFISGFALDAQAKQDLIAFLKSFTDRDFVSNPRYGNPWPHP